MSEEISNKTSVTDKPEKVTEKEKLPKRKVHTSKSMKAEWTFKEKQKFATGLNKGPPFRKEDGNVNWGVLKRFIGPTKTVKQVKEFAKRFNALEHGVIYTEFTTKAAVDVWRELAENATDPGDDIANACIPQVLTVAALEPTDATPSVCETPPNYNNIYSYLSAVTRGSDVPDLPAGDAVVILDLLEDLIRNLSKSQPLVQREFMHDRYLELRYLLEDKAENNLTEVCNGSTNPYAIPFEVLEFKNEDIDNT